jgi:hypothetical protein
MRQIRKCKEVRGYLEIGIPQDLAPIFKNAEYIDISVTDDLEGIVVRPIRR